ncbi:salicylate synthase [Streptomyces umbrinus]|uniref:salicylate synthase n=1 Tax=Streptomyces umbrinus TaxID=67370 RepID=UPI003C2EC4A1
MAERQRYFEFTVPVQGDPMLHATRLARRGPYEQYVVYERQGVWCYAGGVEAELTVFRDVIDFRAGTERSSVPCAHEPLRQVHQLLGSLPLDGWRAYGWASFELSYALADRADEEAPSGGDALLHLVVPAVEVRLRLGDALIRCTDPAMADKVRSLLADADSDPVPAPAFSADISDGGREPYQTAVSAAVSAIRSGELHKVILSRTVEVEQEIDLVGTYVTGRRANNPARSFLLRLGGIEAAGFSPETVVEVATDGTVSTQPLAGTRALTGDAPQDAQLRIELLADAKEVYEHAISVQVAWNEMTAVCAPGSVRVEELMDVKQRGSVQHIASRVTGRLAERTEGPWPALAAVFPAVTASGVPKSAAYDLIRRHEPEPRGLYSGAVLMVGSEGDLDAALVLRTVYRSRGRTWLRAGAGIVGESRPEREFEETCEKLLSVSRHLVPAHDSATAECHQAKVSSSG